MLGTHGFLSSCAYLTWPLNDLNDICVVAHPPPAYILRKKKSKFQLNTQQQVEHSYEAYVLFLFFFSC